MSSQASKAANCAVNVVGDDRGYARPVVAEVVLGVGRVAEQIARLDGRTPHVVKDGLRDAWAERSAARLQVAPPRPQGYAGTTYAANTPSWAASGRSLAPMNITMVHRLKADAGLSNSISKSSPSRVFSQCATSRTMRALLPKFTTMPPPDEPDLLPFLPLVVPFFASVLLLSGPSSAAASFPAAPSLFPSISHGRVNKSAALRATTITRSRTSYTEYIQLHMMTSANQW